MRRTRGVLTSDDTPGRVVTISDARPVVLGRSEECTARFGDSSLSRMHARVRFEGGGYLISDLGSTNGTFVNDRRVSGDVALSDGDVVRLGRATRLVFALVDEAEERSMRAIYEDALRTVKVGDVEHWSSRLQDLEARDVEARDDLNEDLQQARDFQRRALSEPPELEGIEVEVVYQPCALVGGDIYNLTAVEPRRLRVLVADATGHGVKASLTTMLILSEWEMVKTNDASPGRLLADLNERIHHTFGRLGVRFTAACLELDVARGVLWHASAAHPAPCLVRDGKATELECGGTFIGMVAGVEFPEWEVPLTPGDAVVSFTDGLTDALGAGGAMFGVERVLEALAGAHSRPLSAVLRHAVSDFVGGGNPGDDVTILALRWKR